MKKLVLKMMAVCAGALIVSCGSGKNMLSVSSLDGEWNITEVDGQKISTERMPFIGFDVAQKRIYGNSGCNRMMGRFGSRLSEARYIEVWTDRKYPHDVP